jgi:preprotein translocase subunit SecD
MKTLFNLIIVGLLAIISCTTNKNQPKENVSFEIYETLTQKEVPINIVEEFRKMNIELNTDSLSPIIAFIPIDSTIQLSSIPNGTVKFLQTAIPIDKDKEFNAVVAVKNLPALNNSDIKKTKPNQNNIEIYFNLQGANKWAELTKINTGKVMAFSINNNIYTLPYVHAEIKNGIAIIYGLENTDIAIKISESINSSL